MIEEQSWRLAEEVNFHAWREVLNDAKGMDVDGYCPFCGAIALHTWYEQLNDHNRISRGWEYVGRGLQWEWCTSCRTYDYIKDTWVPKWWEPLFELPKAGYEVDVELLENHRRTYRRKHPEPPRTELPPVVSHRKSAAELHTIAASMFKTVLADRGIPLSTVGALTFVPWAYPDLTKTLFKFFIIDDAHSGQSTDLANITLDRFSGEGEIEVFEDGFEKYKPQSSE